jgi:hypothetical protein
MAVNGNRKWTCVECGGSPDLHSIRTAVIRVFNAGAGRWRNYPLHSFKAREGE